MNPETRPVRFKHIVVLDRDEAWLLVMRDAVARGGFQVTPASTPEETLRRVRDLSPDLLLISCLMREADSEFLLQELASRTPPLPVVLVGFKEGESGWRDWVHRPFVTVIRQPFTTTDLLTVSMALLGTTWEDRPRR